MGDVYLAAAADRSGRRRPVALKRLRPSLAEDDSMRARFCDEARLVGMLSGPGVVRPVDVSRVRSHHYYTMEFIDGTTLSDLLRATKEHHIEMPLEASLQIVRGLAAILHRLHEREDSDGRKLKLVHCDVSPSNILITPTGQVRLVDYGLCRGMHQSVPALHHGRVLGTISYMSPEQIAREEIIDHRSDVFSTGILLYEMVTGTRLFRARTSMRSATRSAAVELNGRDSIAPSFLWNSTIWSCERCVRTRGFAFRTQSCCSEPSSDSRSEPVSRLLRASSPASSARSARRPRVFQPAIVAGLWRSASSHAL